MPLTATQATQTASVADVVGETIAAQGVRDAFGILGSGNLVVTNALVRGGARFHHARHEGGAICMADGYGRVTGRVAVCSVHQGPGLTNTMTGLAEAAKSRTPVLVLSGDTPAAALTSNFRIDQHDLVESVGAIAERVHSPRTAADDAQRAYQRAVIERRPVVLMLPIDIQPQPSASAEPSRPPLPPLQAPAPNPAAIEAAADLLAQAKRPAIIAGRGAVLADARNDLEALGQLTGALLATSAPANGLFAGLPLQPRDLGRVRLAIRGRTAPPGRRCAGRRGLGESLDDQARRADRPTREGGPARHRSRARSAATSPPTSPCSATPGPACGR